MAEVPVGAVVVCDGKIVGRGRNRRETKKTHCNTQKSRPSRSAQRWAGWPHRRDLYVTL